jgi:RNA polymerase sigma factor (sigma-70 family)
VSAVTLRMDRVGSSINAHPSNGSTLTLSGSATSPGPAEAGSQSGSFVDVVLQGAEPAVVGAAFADGDPAGLAEAYRRWSPLVYTLALRTLRSESEAEDVTQRVFLQGWRSRGTYDPSRRPLSAWLVGITRHVVADRLSEHTRERELNQRVIASDPAILQTGSSDGIAEQVADAVVVADGLSQLDSPRREVVEMSFFKGLTHAQISASLDMPLGTVKSHIRRGLLELKDHLEVSDDAS